jgi:hypothetical protein
MIAVVSHDAGGAEILSSWLRQNKQPYCLVLGGPAIAIFQRKLGNCKIDPLAKAIDLCDLVLCGTSWQSNLEKQAIAKAKVAGKKVIAFLDHWVEFEGRFQNQGVNVFPDEIWVGDMDAKIIAKKCFPEVAVVLKSNPYFDDLQTELKTIQKPPINPKRCSVLYICEPLSEQALLQYGDDHYYGYTEEDALNFFLKNTGVLGLVLTEIKIRPHPSESSNKYNWARQANSLVTETVSTKTLLEQIVEAEVVVGGESMAMVVGLLAKKRVVSSIPPGGNACSLPQAEIEHLQVLVKKYQGTLVG